MIFEGRISKKNNIFVKGSKNYVAKLWYRSNRLFADNKSYASCPNLFCRTTSFRSSVSSLSLYPRFGRYATRLSATIFAKAGRCSLKVRSYPCSSVEILVYIRHEIGDLPKFARACTDVTHIIVHVLLLP